MPSEIGGCATLLLAPGDKAAQLFLMVAVHCRRFEFGQDLLVDPMRPLRRPDPAVDGPGLVVPPVRQERCIEGGLIAVLGVLTAEIMPRGPDLADRIQGDVVVGGGEG